MARNHLTLALYGEHRVLESLQDLNFRLGIFKPIKTLAIDQKWTYLIYLTKEDIKIKKKIPKKSMENFCKCFIIRIITLEEHSLVFTLFDHSEFLSALFSNFCLLPMENGGVDRTVIDCRQNQLGQMADFPPLLTFLIFDL